MPVLQIGTNRRDAEAERVAAAQEGGWQGLPGQAGGWANGGAASGLAPAPSSGSGAGAGVVDPQLAELLSGVRALWLSSRQEQQLQQAQQAAQQAHPGVVASYMEGRQRVVDERVEEVPELAPPSSR